MKTLKNLLPPASLPLLALLFPDLAPAAGEQAGGSLTLNSPHFLAELRRQALTPFFYQRTAQLRGQAWVESLDLSLLLHLRHDYLSAKKTAAQQEREACRVLGALHEAGVQVILLKGQDLRLRVYGEGAVRPMTDLDLLIAPEQFHRAQAALEGLGFSICLNDVNHRPGFRERFANAALFSPPPDMSMPVDVHWEIWGPAGFYRLPFPRLAEMAESLTYHDLPVRVLSPEHALIHHCLHLYKHRVRLIQIVDLLLMLSLLPISWSRLRPEALRWQCQVPLYSALAEISSLFPTLIPAATLEEWALSPPTLAERLMLSGALGPLSQHLGVLCHHPLTDWPAFVAAKLWPDARYLQAHFGKADRRAYFRRFLGKIFAGKN